MKDKCVWEYTTNDMDYYETSCNNAFQFNYGEKDDNFKYCPYCGKEIEVENER